MPWYVTTTASGVFHVVLDGPFDRREDAVFRFRAFEVSFVLRAGELFGGSGDPTVEVVFIDGVFSPGDRVSAELVRYGRRKRSVKRPRFSSVSDFFRSVLGAEVDREE